MPVFGRVVVYTQRALAFGLGNFVSQFQSLALDLIASGTFHFLSTSAIASVTRGVARF
jgi:hypothetical protein